MENENERSSNEREWTRGDEEEINFLAGGGVVCAGRELLALFA